MGANDAKMQLSPSIFFYDTRLPACFLVGGKSDHERIEEEDIQFDNDTSVSD